MDKRKRRWNVGRIVSVIVLAAVVGLIGFGFMPKPVPVNLGSVERRALEVTVDESGKTRVRNKYVVSAPVTGQLARVTLEAGDQIEEGAVVAEIAPLAPQLLDARTHAEGSARVDVAEANVKRTQASIERARSALEFAKSQAERAGALRSQGGMSEQAFEENEYRLRAAEDELASAQLAERVAANERAAARTTLMSLGRGQGKPNAQVSVLAPAAGEVLRVVQESAGAVQAGAPLLEIGDPRRLEIVVDVLTTDAVPIRVGAAARIERWGGSRPLAARVQRKEPSAFTTRSALGVEEQRVPIVLDIVDDASSWTELDDGYRVEARIRVAYVENALVVPASALFREGDSWAAFAVRADKAAKLVVEVGVRNPDWAEVKKGLSQGDRVVLYPSDQVANGIAVTAQR